MTGRIGRQVQFFFGGNSPADEIQGVREKGVECNGEPVDVTSDENTGLRTLLDNTAAISHVNIKVSGVTKDTRIRGAWHGNQRTQIVSLHYPDGGIITGTFFLSAYNETESYKDASTFEATLMSSGAVTYTP
jgi:predicted secreted protein